MRDYRVYRKAAIRYWERRRIVYNLALIPPTLLGYGLYAGVSAGVGDPRNLTTGVVIVLFLVSVIGANICYSFGYALEFLFGSEAPESRWLRFWRPLLIILAHSSRCCLLCSEGEILRCWSIHSDENPA